MAEWTRPTSLPPPDAHLTGAVLGGLNDPYRLNATTVTDDAIADTLDGGNGADWFLASLTPRPGQPD